MAIRFSVWFRKAGPLPPIHMAPDSGGPGLDHFPLKVTLCRVPCFMGAGGEGGEGGAGGEGEGAQQSPH